MIGLPPLYTGLVVLMGILAAVAVWSPRRLWSRVLAVAVLASTAGVAWFAYADLLSRPKPAGWEVVESETARVLGASMREGEAIYLWLSVPEYPEPRAYVLPWDREVAEQLQGALREAERNGTGVIMQLPFERSWDPQQPKFYALPQPALPPKDAGQPPEAYEHPGQET